jgi:hypothetical protein
MMGLTFSVPKVVGLKICWKQDMVIEKPFCCREFGSRVLTPQLLFEGMDSDPEDG